MIRKVSAEVDAATLRKIATSVSNQELVAVIGTGVSLALTDGAIPTLSWRGLIRNGFEYAVRKGQMKEAQAQTWNAQLESHDIDELLLGAEFMGRKLEAPGGNLYARWLKSVFEQIPVTNRAMTRAIGAIQAAGVPLCTLNFDSLLEQATSLPTVRLSESVQVSEWMLRRKPGILHLHGSWDVPESCILGIRDYEGTLRSEVRDLIQRSLSSFKRLLFIGCGDTFSDPNFHALVVWLRKNMRAATPQHYALVSDGEIAARHADPYWHGFVEPLSYGVDHRSLPEFILKLFPPKAKPNVKNRVTGSTALNRDKEHEKVLRAYKTFLLKDCGEMTLEGVRADMDMAQRKFNLERLFVPLSVVPSTSEKSPTELKRESKGHRREGEEAASSVPFGKVFARRKRIALLALPGGGKSLLLKRLAVAYSDATRREICADGIPAMNVTPVLIRCREWREHIRLPILTLLRKMPDITGQSVLADFCEALIPRLKRGKVLLLVDGLDEIHNDGDRTTFVDHLETFLGEFKHIRLVVTSREAGFSLVAPGLARFCDRYGIAPLETGAIRELCLHWHKLIVGDTPGSVAEAHELALQIERNTALRRLAENPLLLTMILVVKHGAGRLPPDRVTLYARAVDVLLDTWNIRGHAALNLKEAVPQLAYVAFELTKAGKQTATEKELLNLLEDAREKVPQIRLYAQDTPNEFLRRVELRSSLLVEGGHVAERGRTVPFYQFRHLTFQEYLTAVAVVEGHYIDYVPTDTLLTPLKPHLTSPEWKEVVPMAAVLAGKRAEPLLAALVGKSERARPRALEEYPDAVDRLLHCLLEEAQASPATITAALQLIALFVDHGQQESLSALARGPYGKELLRPMAALYRSMEWKSAGMDIAFAIVAGSRESKSYWLSSEGLHKLEQQLNSADDDEVILGLMTAVGLWLVDMEGLATTLAPVFLQAEKHLFSHNVAVVCIAAWAFGAAYMRQNRAIAAQPTTVTLDRLLALWLTQELPAVQTNVALALDQMIGLPRKSWTPLLTNEQIAQVVTFGTRSASHLHKRSATIVAFHAKTIWPDEQVAKQLAALLKNASETERKLIEQSLAELGPVGGKQLRKRKKQHRGPTTLEP